MSEQSEQNFEFKQWAPLSFEELLKARSLFSIQTISILLVWILLIGISMYSVLTFIPESWVSATIESADIFIFFLFYPPLFIGTLLLFWFGFEWGFVPVFLSSFVIAFSASMPIQWALLFAISFILGLGIYGLAYYCVPVRIDLRSLKSISFYVVVSLVAAMAASLGSFVWSFEQNLSPAQSIQLWNSWWTGAFLQSIFISGPVLLIATPAILKIRNKIATVRPRDKVTLNWIYGAITSVVLVISLFLAGGRILGNKGIESVLRRVNTEITIQVLQVTESYQILFWVSVAIILIVGATGIYLVSQWNRSLQTEVHEKTASLLEREKQLKNSVQEREKLLNEIHGRVEKNLTMILTIYEYQLKKVGDELLEESLRNSKYRFRSISAIHEVMSKSDSFNHLNLKNYANKISNQFEWEFRNSENKPEVNLNAREDIVLEFDRAVLASMVLSEFMSTIYEFSTKNTISGLFQIDLFKEKNQIKFWIRHRNSKQKIMFDWTNEVNLSLRLIRSLVNHLNGELMIDEFSSTATVSFPADKL